MPQLSLFPDMKPSDKNILFVIGNGFDIAHGIESRYTDFKNCVDKKGNRRLIDMMDTFFSNSGSLWEDIENALGDYEENAIADYCNPNSEIDYDHPTQYTAAYEDSPDWIFKPIVDEFLESFTQWVDSVDIGDIELIRDLSTESKYLTFNYTETLEIVYGIPQNQICHIHGSRLKKDEYIIGHNKFYSPGDAYQDESVLLYVQETCFKIINWMNELYKNSAAIIRVHKSFFDGLSDIEKVEVIGHSFNEIDLPYLEEVVKMSGKDIPWLISYHSDEDFKAIDTFVTSIGLNNVRKYYL